MWPTSVRSTRANAFSKHNGTAMPFLPDRRQSAL